MNRFDLITPILESGIRNTNFFNGRLLSAEDLRTEQAANRLQHGQLGRAIGDGVAFGLAVSKSTVTSPSLPGTSSVVRVTAGMAINRKGQALELAEDADVALIREKETLAEEAGFFAVCEPPTTAVPTGTGVYVLVIAPASGFEGKAPMSGLGGNGSGGRGCGRRYAVEGVQFRLVELKINTMTNVSQATRDEITKLMTDTSKPDTTPDPAKLSMLRNRLAHLCFGTEELIGYARDPLERESVNSLYPGYGALMVLRSEKRITDCDVPLVLIYWTMNGIQFLDMWPVRRLSAITGNVFLPSQQEIYASILQFQSQLDDLPNQKDMTLATGFHYIPPFGCLPAMDSRVGSSAGWNLKSFFGQRVNKLPSIIKAGEWTALLREAVDYLPDSVPQLDGIDIFLIQENVEAVLKGTESQLYAYYAFPQLARQYCAPAVIIDKAGTVGLDVFYTTLSGCAKVYADFRNLFFSQLMTASMKITREDMLGISAIDQVLMVVESLVTDLTACCMNNHALWVNLSRVAVKEQFFAATWLDSVLAQEGGKKYHPEIKQLIEKIKSFIESAATDGVRGLVPSLSDHDLYSANLAQLSINQTFNRLISVGPHGAISVSYTVPPVVTGDPPALAAGKYIIGYTLNASVDKQASYRLSPSIAAFGWDAELWDETADQPRSTDIITLPKSSDIQGGISQPLKVRLTMPDDAAGTSGLLVFDVTETSGSGGVPPAREEITFVIGQAPPTPDNRVIVSLIKLGSAAHWVDHAVSIPKYGMASAQFNVRITVPGVDFAFELKNADAKEITWEILTLDSYTYTSPSTPGVYNVVVSAQLKPGATALNTDLLFKVTSATSTFTPAIDETYRLPVVLRTS